MEDNKFFYFLVGGICLVFGIVLGSTCNKSQHDTPIRQDSVEQYETLSCKFVEQRGDTMIVINKMIKLNNQRK